MVVSIVTNLVLLPVGYILDRIISGFTFAMIALTSYHVLWDLISVSIQTDPHIQIRKSDSNCTSQTNLVYLAGTHCSLSEPELLNAFERIE